MISRRRLLGLLTAGAAGLCTTATSGWAEKRKVDVIVLGAGAAGLAAAGWLARQDYQVLVLEARARLGGRIWTDTSLGFPCDLGASWIHESVGNPLTKMCRELSVDTVVDPDNWQFFDSQGRGQPQAVQDRVDRLNRKVSESDVSGQISIEAACQKLIERGQIGADAQPDLRIFYHGCATENGVLPQEAALDTLRDEGYSGPDRLFPKGYGQLVAHWSQGLNVLTNHRVVGVEWGKSGVKVATDKGAFEGRACVVTLPLGVLQSGSIQFDPRLPLAQQKALSLLKMGVLDKVVLRYQEPNWPKANHFGFPYQPVGAHGEVTNLQSLLGVPALMSFLAGDPARQREKWTAAALIEELTSTIRPIWGGARPGPVVASLITRWGQDPYSQGSYSYLPPQVEPSTRSLLGQAQWPLFFAGEATNEKLPATVHGAYLSGTRAAKELDRDWKD